MEKQDLRDRDLYRRSIQAPDLVPFRLTVKETDLMILAQRDLAGEAREAVLTERHRLEEYIGKYSDFLASLVPLAGDDAAPEIARLMYRASTAAGVGPMAAVAGAIAELVGRTLREYSPELIIENGGDVLIAGWRERTVGIYTAEKDLEARLGVKVRPGGATLGVCTSSGRFGHSLSLGEASTATVISPSAALADAAATAVCNAVRGENGVEAGMELARSIEGVTGAVIVREGKLAAWGAVELVPAGKG